MTLKEAIDKYNANNANNPSNPYDFGVLTDLINTIEQTIQTELLNTFPFVVTTNEDTGEIIRTPGTLVSYDWAEDQETALLLTGSPFEDVYGLYVTAMVNFNQGEWTKYANTQAMFNARYKDASAYYARTAPRVQKNTMHNYW